MPGPFTLAELDDAGEVGQPRLPSVLTLAGLDDGGLVGKPSVQIEYAPPDITPVPVGAPSHSTVLPEVAVQVVDFDHQHVSWLPLALGGASARRSLGDPGAVLVPMSREDPALTDLDFEDRILRYWLRGNLVAAGLVGPRDDATIDPAEEAGQTVTVGGPGTLAVLAEGSVDPWQLDWYPDMNAQRFNFAHPDYDDTAWTAASVKALQGDVTAHWTGSPQGWDDPLAAWIGGPYGTSDDAPAGVIYGRGWFNVSGGKYALKWTGDNSARVSIDGVEIATAQNWTNLQRVDLELSDGDHLMAWYLENPAQDTPNPSGMVMSLREILGQGVLGDVVFRTSGTGWKVLQQPLVEPGWMPGKIVRYLLAKWAARGGRSISTSFTDTVDSAGQAWPSVPETTIQCGSTLLQAVQQIAENYMDVQMAPGSWTLHAYNKGTLGTDLDLTLAGPDHVADEDACLASLRHRSSPPLATSLLVRWQDNWLRRTVTPPAGHRRREKHLQLPTVRTAAGAAEIADNVLDTFSQVRTEYQFEVVPRNETQVLGIAVKEGDTVRLPSRDGALESVRVQSWSVSCDQDGLVSFGGEAGDRIAEAQERVDNWLARMADGALGGQTDQALADRFDRYAYTASTVVVQELIFQKDAGAPDESPPKTVASAGIINEFRMDIPGGEGGTFHVYVNGSSVASLTVAAGPTQAAKLGLSVPVARGDIISAYSTAAIDFVLTVSIV